MDIELTKNKRTLSVKAIVHFAAPQTWPAAVLSSLLGGALAAGFGFTIRPFILFGVLITSVLLQAAVNTLNDYQDFVSGLDSAENCDDPDDAAMVYDCSSPKAAMVLALLFMLAAAVSGLLLVWQTGPLLFIFAGIGLAAILIYTVPAISFFKLPVGEWLSGGTMGGVITMASWYAQTGYMDLRAVLCCIPAVIMIGSILCVNNTCDIEKDKTAGRRTFSICVGRRAAQQTMRVAVLIAVMITIIEMIQFFPNGIAAAFVMCGGLLFNYGVQGLFMKDLTPAVRAKSMGGILAATKWVVGGLCAAALIHGLYG